MVDVDEGACDEERGEDPVDEDLWAPLGELFPWAEVFAEDGVEDEGGEEFDEEVAEGDGVFAGGAFALLEEPGDEGDVAVDGDGFFAVWAEGAFGVVEGDVEWEAVDDDVEEGADVGADHEDGGVDEEFDEWDGHGGEELV